MLQMKSPDVPVLLTISSVKRENLIVSKHHLFTSADVFRANVIANVRIVFNDRQHAHNTLLFYLRNDTGTASTIGERGRGGILDF